MRLPICCARPVERSVIFHSGCIFQTRDVSWCHFEGFLSLDFWGEFRRFSTVRMISTDRVWAFGFISPNEHTTAFTCLVVFFMFWDMRNDQMDSKLVLVRNWQGIRLMVPSDEAIHRAKREQNPCACCGYPVKLFSPFSFPFSFFMGASIYFFFFSEPLSRLDVGLGICFVELVVKKGG